MKKYFILACTAISPLLSSCDVSSASDPMKLWFALFIGAIVVVLFVVFIVWLSSRGCSAEDQESRIYKMNRYIADNHHVSANVRGPNDSFILVADDVDKNIVIITSPESKKIIPFSDIMAVELAEDGVVVHSKSIMRSVGGALVGSVLAGGVGMVIGGLNGKTREKKDILSISVIIKLRSLSQPSVTLNCYDKTMLGVSTDDGSTIAQRIVRLLEVIIDNNNRQADSSPATSANALSNVEALEKLIALKEKGMITDEEFSSMKSQIIKQ